MTVIDVVPDTEAHTLTLSAQYAATPERVWQLWADARQLERWWGPPTHPATFTEHELVDGGRSSYFLTSPDGERYHAWWLIDAIDAPHGLRFQDHFGSHDDPPADMPVSQFRVRIEPVGAETRMTIACQFPSREAMQQLLDMGMQDGLTQAVGQVDALLAEAAAPVA